MAIIRTSINLVVQGLVYGEKLTDPTIEAIGFVQAGIHRASYGGDGHFVPCDVRASLAAFAR